MYDIKKTDFGFRLTFGGYIEIDELRQWFAEIEKAMQNAPKRFGVFVDMRELTPMPPECQELMTNAQAIVKKKGMWRSVVILDSTVTGNQFKRLASASGIAGEEKYINASTTPNWEKEGMDWLLEAVDSEPAPSK